MPKMKVLQLPETKYAIATEHRIPEDGLATNYSSVPVIRITSVKVTK